MIQLYFKGQWSNSCQEVPDGTMITVQSQTDDAIYSALKNMGCSHGAASFAASTSKWETAQEREKRLAKQSAPKNDKTESQDTTITSSDDSLDEYDGGGDSSELMAIYLDIRKPEVKKEISQIAKRREKIASDTSLSATERLKETLNCIVQAYHSQNSVIVEYRQKCDLERKTISEIKQVIKQFPIPTEDDELTDFIKYVKSGAIKPKMMGILDIINKILDFVLVGGSDDDDNYDMEDEDKIIGNLLYQKLWEIAEVVPEHPLIRKEKLKKVGKRIIILSILLFVCYLVWDLVSFIIKDYETW